MQDFWNTIRPYLWELMWAALGAGLLWGVQQIPAATVGIEAPEEVHLTKGKLVTLTVKASAKMNLLASGEATKNFDVVPVGENTWHIVPHMDAKAGVYSVPVVASVGGKLSPTYWVRLVVE